MKLYDYQTAGVKWLLSTKRGFLCDATGLGKTLQAITAAIQSGKRVLVVCPKYVASKWVVAIEARGCTVAAVFGETKKAKLKAAATIPSCTFTITNYETLGSDVLAGHTWDCVISDEAQFLQGRSSKRTEAFKKLVKKAEFVWLLTATPVWNQPDSLWSLLNILYPKDFSSFWRFVYQFCLVVETPFCKEIKGINPASLPRLKALLAPILLRRLKADVLKDLPTRVETELALEIPRALLKESRHIKKLMKDDGTVNLARLRVHLLDRESFNFTTEEKLFETKLVPVKLEALRNILVNETGKKALVFVKYQESAKVVLNWLSTMGLSWYNKVPITGLVNVPDREKIIEEFKAAPGSSVLLGTAKTMGTGIDLQFASVAIFLEHPHLWSELEQAIGRVERIGTVEPPTIYHLYQKGTLDEKVWKACKAREELSDAVLLED